LFIGTKYAALQVYIVYWNQICCAAGIYCLLELNMLRCRLPLMVGAVGCQGCFSLSHSSSNFLKFLSKGASQGRLRKLQDCIKNQ
jgi:hypothetical protein